MEKVKKKKKKGRGNLLHDQLLYIKTFTRKNNYTDFMTIQRIVSGGYRVSIKGGETNKMSTDQN